MPVLSSAVRNGYPSLVGPSSAARPHLADRPHLFAGKYTEEYLLSVRRDFDARGGNLAALPSGWFYCMECKHMFPLKFMGNAVLGASCHSTGKEMRKPKFLSKFSKVLKLPQTCLRAPQMRLGSTWKFGQQVRFPHFFTRRLMCEEDFDY